MAVVQIDIGETSQERVTAAIQGLLLHAYFDLAVGNDDRYENLRRLAIGVYQHYVKQTSAAKGNVRIPLPPFDTLNQEVLNQLLDPQEGLPYAARAVLRTHFGLPAESTAAAATNSPPTVTIPSTNAPVQ